MDKKTAILLIVISLFICGCSDIPGKLLVMEGNTFTSRGLYNEAVIPYMRALKYAESAPYGEYGLGSVYFTLGEDKAALDRFAIARQLIESYPSTGNREIRYRIHYNTGVVLFSTGDYSGAADSFREALRTDGSRIESKRNLELSLRLLARENTGNNGNNDTDNESKAAFFDYIRHNELNRWRNREWPDEDEAIGPDY
jgi:Ca-activated chloride channel family protein